MQTASVTLLPSTIFLCRGTRWIFASIAALTATVNATATATGNGGAVIFCSRCHSIQFSFSSNQTKKKQQRNLPRWIVFITFVADRVCGYSMFVGEKDKESEKRCECNYYTASRYTFQPLRN